MAFDQRFRSNGTLNDEKAVCNLPWYSYYLLLGWLQGQSTNSPIIARVFVEQYDSFVSTLLSYRDETF